MNTYRSSRVTHELNTKVRLSKAYTFWSPTSTKVRTKLYKLQRQRGVAGYSWALSEFSRKVQSIRWLNMSRKVYCNIFLLSVALNFSTFESSTAIKKKLWWKIHFGIICKSPHEEFRMSTSLTEQWKELQLYHREAWSIDDKEPNIWPRTEGKSTLPTFNRRCMTFGMQKQKLLLRTSG